MNGTSASVRYPDLSLSNCSKSLLATSNLFLATVVYTLGLDYTYLYLGSGALAPPKCGQRYLTAKASISSDDTLLSLLLSRIANIDSLS